MVLILGVIAVVLFMHLYEKRQYRQLVEYAAEQEIRMQQTKICWLLEQALYAEIENQAREQQAAREKQAQARKAFEDWIAGLATKPSASNQKTTKELFALRQSMRPWEEQ